MNLALIFLLTSFIQLTLSHPGGTIKSGPKRGCHQNKKLGTFHCHGPSNESVPPKHNKYNRDLFKHWIDTDGDCLNTRHEILKQRSLSPVTINSCRVITGEWKDFYYDEVLLKSSQIDIDHLIPLRNAWSSGAMKWTSKQREEFANDPENLVITNLKYNRQKGARTPLEWLPISKEYACKYVSKWILLKRKYSLSISSGVKFQLKKMNCSELRE